MVAAVLGGIQAVTLDQDDDGHRVYMVRYQVGAAVTDGPHTIMNATGLPAIGSTWAGFNDADTWAFCTPYRQVRQRIEKEPNTVWDVTCRFTTNPTRRCQDGAIENPLDEPDRIGGSFQKYTAEAPVDKDGAKITNSSYEQIRGATVERDYNRPTVWIERNVASLPLTTYAPMVDTLNDATLWGMAARSVKLDNISWTRLIYGVCTYYYQVRYEFSIDYLTFDRIILDEGTMVLGSGGSPNNPEHYVLYKDINGENTRVILDGAGKPWNGTGSPGEINVQLYGESNFLLLGIPTSL